MGFRNIIVNKIEVLGFIELALQRHAQRIEETDNRKQTSKYVLCQKMNATKGKKSRKLWVSR